MQNIVILAGNIGQDPEAVTTQAGTRITRFTLAPANVQDLAVAPQLLKGREGYVIGDRNYWSPELTKQLLQE